MPRGSCPTVSRRHLKGTGMIACVTGQLNTKMQMTEFYVKVEPNSETFQLKENSILRAKVKSKAENSRANTELVKELSEILGEKPGIVSGHKSRRKKLRVDLTEKELNEKMEENIRG